MEKEVTPLHPRLDQERGVVRSMLVWLARGREVYPTQSSGPFTCNTCCSATAASDLCINGDRYSTWSLFFYAHRSTHNTIIYFGPPKAQLGLNSFNFMLLLSHLPLIFTFFWLINYSGFRPHYLGKKKKKENGLMLRYVIDLPIYGGSRQTGTIEFEVITQQKRKKKKIHTYELILLNCFYCTNPRLLRATWNGGVRTW